MTDVQRQGLLTMAEDLRAQTAGRIGRTDGKDLKDLIACVKELAALYKTLEDPAQTETVRVEFADGIAAWTE